MAIACDAVSARSSGNPKSSPKNAASAAMPTRRDTVIGACSATIRPVWRQSHAPVTAPNRMAASWENADVLSSTMSAAPPAIEARSRSGQSVRAMPHTAWATTATATSFSPCSNPVPTGPLNAAAL
jgi:hypothetical protein